MLKDFYVIGYFKKPVESVLRSLDAISDTKHLTILPRFTMDESNIARFTDLMSPTLEKINPSGINEYHVKSIRSETFFNGAEVTHVQIIDKTIEIEELHLTLFEIAKNLSTSFQNPAYSGDGYNPHVSHTEKGFKSQLTHVGLTAYQEVPFKSEILSLFDLNSNSEVACYELIEAA